MNGARNTDLSLATKAKASVALSVSYCNAKREMIISNTLDSGKN